MSMNSDQRDDTCSCSNQISCTVENCVYHDGKTSCTAKEVNVGPHYACCCQDTVCSTFKQEK